MFRRRNVRCIKKRAHLSFPCTPAKPVQRPVRIHGERECARMGASPLTCRSYCENLDVFRWNDLLALMPTLGLADFSPPHQSFTDSASAYLHKTPRIIPQPGGERQTPAKNHRRGHRRQRTSGALNHLSRVLERTARHERPYVASGKHGLQDAAFASIGDHHVSAGLGRYANRLELRVHSAL